jgi:hypothetical protein
VDPHQQFRDFARAGGSSPSFGLAFDKVRLGVIDRQYQATSGFERSNETAAKGVVKESRGHDRKQYGCFGERFFHHSLPGQVHRRSEDGKFPAATQTNFALELGTKAVNAAVLRFIVCVNVGQEPVAKLALIPINYLQPATHLNPPVILN